MSVEVEWTTASVIHLVNEYRKRPELWDHKHESFRQATARYEAWDHLATMFNCDIADLRKKINSIFASHRREKAKVRFGGRSQWFLYPHLKFLPSHLENNAHSKPSNAKDTWHQSTDPGTDDEKEDNSNDDSDQHETIVEEITIKDEPYTVAFNQPKRAQHQATTNRTRYSRPIRKKLVKRPATSQLDSRLLEALKTVRRSNSLRQKDECDSFGEYIADSLRKHDERTQSMIKQAINNILFEQEMKKYSVGQYSVVISDMDIDTNPLILGDSESSDPTHVAK